MNKLLRVLPLLAIAVLFCNQDVASQDSAGLYDKVLYFPDKLFKKINDKADDINDRLLAQSKKHLQRLAKEERRMQKKLAKKDSTAAARIFGDVEKRYAGIIPRSFSEGSHRQLEVFGAGGNNYIPHLDTLRTALSFLDKTDGLLKDVPETKALLERAMGNMDELQNQFNKAEEVKKFLLERRQFLQEQLNKYGFVNEFKKFRKQVYYYQAQVEEYKRIFEEPSKLEAHAIALLKQTSLFKDFFSKHSQLAGLFRLPGVMSVNSMETFAGLQTRVAIREELMQRFGSGPNVQQVMQQQMQGAQSALGQMKDKINKVGGGNSDMEMVDFKPNNQKTKRLKDRLEFGTNLQTVKSNRFFPSTSDMGLSVGYKLNDKSIVGIGGSYKWGWGKDIRHIKISHEGVGLRSFVDYKIKGGFWVSGGAEFNYRSHFDNFEVLKSYGPWQKSALLGVSKKYQFSKKLKGNFQLMYDFLWKVQVPRTQAFIVRLGYRL